MRGGAFAKLYDHASGLTCHQVPVNATTDALVESVRDIFIASIKEFGYVGYSREIDDVFHKRSAYIYITKSEKVVMTCRVTTRSLGEIMPFEMGLREDGGSYRLAQEEQAVDINTYTYVRGYYEQAMPLLAAGLGYYSKLIGAQSAYCLYDVRNEKIKRAYASIGFVLSSRFPEAIHFPTYCRLMNDRLESVRWSVMEWDFKTIETHARDAEERYLLSRGSLTS